MARVEVWERTRNPWTLLQDVSRERLEILARAMSSGKSSAS